MYVDQVENLARQIEDDHVTNGEAARVMLHILKTNIELYDCLDRISRLYPKDTIFSEILVARELLDGRYARQE